MKETHLLHRHWHRRIDCSCPDAGLRKLIIGLGGSATNDGGIGMLQAFGMSFVDEKGVELPRDGGSLGDLHTIDMLHFDNRISESSFLIACDVVNPFVGPMVLPVFGPQKGASPVMVKGLDGNLTRLANVVEQLNGIFLHGKKGSGAAGGAGVRIRLLSWGNGTRC